jgi:alkanesulfonate monooxygenase SsuD/methylene tetrahydromethanopterin reductase-like flavin-dependent oxidoreductase (luciferase family)
MARGGGIGRITYPADMPRLTFGVALDFGSQLRPLSAQLERQSALLEAAEEAGFEIVAAGETTSPHSFHLPNALLVLAAVATRTRLRLCTGIALLPAWPVWRLALDTAEVDQLSGGRLILGVGLGSRPVQTRAGWPADAIGETVDDTLRALRALWSGADGYTGAQVRVDDQLPILPVQGADVPIWVGGAIRRSAMRAARLGQGWYAGVNFRLSALPRQTSVYREALGSLGGSVAVNRVTLVAERSGTVQERFEAYLSAGLAAYGKPGESVEHVLDEIALVGTPAQVVKQLQRYAEAGVTHIFARLSLDEMPPEVARETIQAMGREIIPRFA